MLTVSNYHYIRENFTAQYPSIFGVTPSIFRNQLMLLKNSADFVSAADLMLNGDEILNSKENYYFITFDDGLKEQYQLALPILDELQIPSVLFVNSRNYEDKKVTTVHKIHLLRSILAPSKFLDNIVAAGSFFHLSDLDKKNAKSTYIYDTDETASLKYILNFKMDYYSQEKVISNIFNEYFDEAEILNELYMNESEIIQLSSRGYIGSHTHNHYPIGLLSDDEIKFELQNSKIYLEKLTGSNIDLVSYPYGTPDCCTLEVAEIAKKTGYKFGFTTTRGINSKENNPLLLNRYDCNDLPGGKNFKQQ